MECAVFAGLTTLIVTYPFDVVKTRLSLDLAKKGEAKAYNGIWNCMKVSKKHYGVRSWYSGFVLASLSTVPYVAISLASYDILRDVFIVNKSKESGVNPVLRYVGLGTIAGLFAQLATYPLDTIRKRLQVNLGTETMYKGSLDCIKKTLAREGVKGFYAGIVPTLLKVAPAAAIQFTAYDLLKEASAKTNYF